MVAASNAPIKGVSMYKVFEAMIKQYPGRVATAAIVTVVAISVVSSTLVNGNNLTCTFKGCEVVPAPKQVVNPVDEALQKRMLPKPTTDLEWRLNEANRLLLLEHPNQAKGANPAIIKVFPNIYKSKDQYQKISISDAARAVEDPVIADALKVKLSYLEALSSAYLDHTVNREVFEKNWRKYIVKNYLAFQHVLPEFKSRCDCVFLPFETLGAAWSASAPSARETEAVWKK